jgi:5-methylcytosine-specific restriction endonuclease McrA
VPYRIIPLGSAEVSFWVCGKKVMQLLNDRHLSEEEQMLEIAHAILRREKRYNQIRRQLEAYARLEQGDTLQRERIAENVRLFVWQRDEGKCVKCSDTERLEFDHIIPSSKGGSSTERNIQLLCETCNREKCDNI